MDNKILSKLSERELEFKEKSLKASFYLLAGACIFCAVTMTVSSYMRYMATQTMNLGWETILFILPLYMVFQAKKELNEVKAEFERRRYR
jgi:hypothetical protein